MKKQVSYPKLIPRIFSTCLDMFILFIGSGPIIHFIQYRVFLWQFSPYLIKHGINASNKTVLLDVWQSEEFRAQVTLSDFLSYVACYQGAQLVIIAAYFIYFWSSKGWTTGKYLAGMRVVDANTLEKITVWQATKRFFGSSLFLVGVFMIFVTDKSQMLHDKIAGTVVIKR